MEKNNNNVNVISLFSTPVLVTNIGRDFTKDELQLLLSDIPMWKDISTGESNHRSKELCLFDKFADNKGLKDIKSFCEQQFDFYLKEIEGIDTNIAGLKITQSWLNVNKPGEYHHIHTHPNSYLSGILYIKCLPDDHINLEKPSQMPSITINFPIKKMTQWNTTGIRQTITEGDLILFPSWIPHYVNVNETKETRVSFAFNTFPIGEMGKYSSVSQLFLK